MAKKGNVLELFARLRAVKAQAGVLEQEERAIKQQLALLVPAGTTKDGVAHVLREHASTKWAQAWERCVKELVPSTKRELAGEIRDACTTRGSYSVFEEA